MRALFAAALLLAPLTASAFGGVYLSTLGAPMFSDASRVVVMREGSRTVLTMQNAYRGPVEGFALLIPVPGAGVKKDQVKVLPRELFERVDALTSPRLIEEIEPGICPPLGSPEAMGLEKHSGAPARDLAVKVDAKFEVGEYEISIVSAGLERWLTDNKYQLPGSTAPMLKPYADAGWKFVVAKVNPKKVTFGADGRAVLSPLRFQYDSDKLVLPVRLGLLNSAGVQDLTVVVIARQRYEVANLKNVTVPTNIRLKPAGEAAFTALYGDLIRRTFEKYPGTAITELAWEGVLPPPQVLTAQGIYGVTCDPCPPPSPVDETLARMLGADAMPGVKNDVDVATFVHSTTVTRLHLRYSKDTLGDDLVFKPVEPLAGGTPEAPKASGSGTNRFQARYIVHKPFDQSHCGWSSRGEIDVAPPALDAHAEALPSPIEELLLSDVPELGLKAKKK